GALGVASSVSCRSEQPAASMALAQRIEPVLRDLLTSQRKAISIDASFAYESDVFAGGAHVTAPDRLAIGRWQITISGDTAEARLQQQYGQSGHVEWDVVDVDLDLRGDAVGIVDWRAYHAWGEYVQ
ncbi:MAG TPA: hypothetical protein PLP66_11180, partial [Phycisphaerae bacterium]|nr:hypothetical protein [Phycisphaerae bacterium]